MLHLVLAQPVNIGKHIWVVLIHGENHYTVMAVENELKFVLVDKMDLRYEIIKERLSSLTKTEIQRIIDNIDDVCFDEFNYDQVNHKFCPLAMAMELNELPNPTDEIIKNQISKRFNPVNVIKGIEGKFYRDNRKEDLINLCKKLLEN